MAAVPIVRATGGLDDTIDESTGFKFSEYEPQAPLPKKIREALSRGRFSGDRVQWSALMRTGMSRDFSWGSSAAKYQELYKKLLNS